MTSTSPAPLVSVVTPAYRPGAEDLGVVVEALGHQTYPAIEWVLVDDASGTDFDAVFASSIAASPVPARLIRLDRNSRQAAARNRGVREARGTYVKFIDADDSLDDRHIDALVDAARAGGEGIIPFAPTRHVFTATGRTKDNLTYRGLPEEREAQLVRLLDAPFLHHCGALFRRDLLLELGPYDESLTTDEDGDLLMRAVLAGGLYRAVPEVRFLYRHHDARRRVSSDDELPKLEARAKVARKLLAHGEPSAAVRAAIARRLDAVALKAWPVDRSVASSLIAEARAIEPGERSGSRLERTLRSLLGVSLSQWIMRRLRRMRGLA